jgi:hypothetical protein
MLDWDEEIRYGTRKGNAPFLYVSIRNMMRSVSHPKAGGMARRMMGW